MPIDPWSAFPDAPAPPLPPSGGADPWSAFPDADIPIHAEEFPAVDDSVLQGGGGYVPASPAPPPLTPGAWAGMMDAGESPQPAPVVAPDAGDVSAPDIITPERRNVLQRYIGDPFMRGLLSANQSMGNAYTMMGLPVLGDPGRQAQSYFEDEAEKEKYRSPDIAAQLQRISDAPKTFKGAALALAANPAGAENLFVESAASSIPAMLLGGGIGGGFVKDQFKNLAGKTVFKKVLQKASRILPRAAGFGAGSALTEYGAALTDILNRRGVDLQDKDALVAAFTDPNFIAEAESRGIKRAAVIGLADTLSAGAAGQIGGPVAKALGGGRMARTAGGGAEVFAQALSGAGGEAGGQVATEGRVTEPLDILMEGLVETVTGIPEIVAGAEIDRPRVPKQPPLSEKTEDDRRDEPYGTGQAGSSEGQKGPMEEQKAAEAAPPPASGIDLEVQASPAPPIAEVARQEPEAVDIKDGGRKGTVGAQEPQATEPDAPYSSLDEREAAIGRLQGEAASNGFDRWANDAIREATEYGVPENTIRETLTQSDRIKALNDLEVLTTSARAANKGMKQGFGIGKPATTPSAPVNPAAVQVRQVDVRGAGRDREYLIVDDQGRKAWVRLGAIDANGMVSPDVFNPTRAKGQGKPTKKAAGPLTLRGFVRKNGGIVDAGGELRSQDIHRNPKFSGVIKNTTGIGADVMMRRAQEAGYFPAERGDRPDVLSGNDLIEALLDEAAGNNRYSDRDLEKVKTEADRTEGADIADQNAMAMDNARTVAADHGRDLTDDEAMEVAGLLAAGRDALDAIDEVQERTAIQLETDLSETYGEQPQFEGEDDNGAFDFTEAAGVDKTPAKTLQESEPGGKTKDRAVAEEPEGDAGPGQGEDIPLIDAPEESARTIAARNRDRRIKGKPGQKGIDFGLFDAENEKSLASQGDIFEDDEDTSSPNLGGRGEASVLPAAKEHAPQAGAGVGGGERSAGDAATYKQRLISLRRSIWVAAGVDARLGENLPPGRQLELFVKMFRDKYDLDVVLDKGGDMLAALNNLKDYFVEIQAMASIMRMPEKAVGLRMGDPEAKALKIVFKRDKKKGYLGLFRPEEKEIVIPGRARSFAHEFFHAVDYRMMERMGATVDAMGKHFRGYTGRIRREGLDYEPGTIEEAMVNVLDAMFFDDAFKAGRLMALQGKLDRAKSDRSRDLIKKRIDAVLRGDDKAFAFRSEYYKNAKSLPTGGDKGYWTRPTEMWARMGEAYIAHRAAAAGIDIKAVAADGSVYEGSAAEFSKMYPHDGDRFRIFSALDSLLDAVAREGILTADLSTDEAMFPNDAEYADPARWFRAMPGYEKPSKSLKDIILGTAEERKERRRAAAHMAGFAKNRPVNGVTVWRYARDAVMMYGSAISHNLKVIAKRNNSATLDGLVKKITQKGSGYWDLHDEFYNRETALLYTIYERSELSRFDDKQMDILGDLLLGLRQDVPAGYDRKKMLDAASGLREMLDGIPAALREDYGVDVGYIKDMDVHYLPSVPDRAWTMVNREAAIREYAAAYALKFEEELEAVKSGKLEPEDATFDPEKFDIEKESAQAAEYLVDQIILGDDLNYGVIGVPGGFTKRRTFPGKAAKVLPHARIHNPVDLIEGYIAAAAKKAAFTKLFDPTEGAYNDSLRQMLKDGVPAREVSNVNRLIRSATRTTGGNETVLDTATGLLEGAKVLLSMPMLARTQLLAIGEPSVAYMRTGDIRDAVLGFSDVVNENLLRADAEERRHIVEALGILPHARASTILLDREGGTFGNTPKLTRMASEVFLATQVTAVTEATRRGNLATAGRYFFRMALDARGDAGDFRAKKAREEMIHSGVPAGRFDEIVDYIIGRQGDLPGLDSLRDRIDDPGRVWGRMLSAAVSDMTQNVKPSDRSWAMNTAIGGILFAYPGFQMRIYEHVFKRNFKKTVFALKEGGPIEGAKAVTLGLVLPWTFYYSTQVALYALKTMLMNRASWEKKDDDEKMKALLMGGLAYSLPFGYYGDFAFQFWQGTKYQKSLAGMFAGKAGYFWDAADAALRLVPGGYQKNSPDNNKQERGAVEGLYRAIVLPAMGVGLAVLPAGPVLKGAAGLGYAYAGSRDAQHAISMGLVGETEKETKSREKAERKAARAAGQKP